jgi:hypothetical protein
MNEKLSRKIVRKASYSIAVLFYGAVKSGKQAGGFSQKPAEN